MEAESQGYFVAPTNRDWRAAARDTGTLSGKNSEQFQYMGYPKPPWIQEFSEWVRVPSP